MQAALILTAVLLSGSACIPQADDEAVLQRGRVFTQRFYGGETEGLWADFTDEMQAALGSVEALSAFRDQVGSQLGVESEILEESVRRLRGLEVYTRMATFEQLSTPINVVWSFDADGRVAGFTITPVRSEAPSDKLEYETKTALRLPFEDEWHIVWGGRTLDQNYHAFTEDQRFACDILALRDGKSHQGEGAENTDYYCFGRRVLAPGQGVVVQAHDGVDDNVPGRMNPAEAMGNHVIIDHGNGEFSFLAHFQQGTVAVKTGDEVESGDLLGLCGNSGNSSEPHIHYHLHDTPEFGRGHGLPAQFLDYVADGQVVERGEPVQGQTVSLR